jgi:hypothetical protein
VFFAERAAAQQNVAFDVAADGFDPLAVVGRNDDEMADEMRHRRNSNACGLRSRAETSGAAGVADGAAARAADEGELAGAVRADDQVHS